MVSSLFGVRWKSNCGFCTRNINKETVMVLLLIRSLSDNEYCLWYPLHTLPPQSPILSSSILRLFDISVNWVDKTSINKFGRCQAVSHRDWPLNIRYKYNGIRFIWINWKNYWWWGWFLIRDRLTRVSCSPRWHPPHSLTHNKQITMILTNIPYIYH